MHNLHHPSLVAVGDSRSEPIFVSLENGEPARDLLARTDQEVSIVVSDLRESNPHGHGQTRVALASIADAVPGKIT